MNISSRLYYSVMLCLFSLPSLTNALVLYQGPNSKKRFIRDSFYAGELLKEQQVVSSEYTKRIAINADASVDPMRDEVLQGKIGATVFFPWIIPTGYVDPMNDRHEGGIILGNFNKFPAYLSIGFLSFPQGRYHSELLTMWDLSTCKTYYADVDLDANDAPELLGIMGVDYAFTDQHKIKVAGAFSEKVTGIGFEYEFKGMSNSRLEDILNSQLENILIGGSRSSKANGFYIETALKRLWNINNPVKFKFEFLKNKEDLDFGLHTELSYHFPLYYFGNRSAFVFGGELSGLEKEINSSDTFAGFKINFLRYFDVVVGGKYNSGAFAQLQVSI